MYVLLQGDSGRCRNVVLLDGIVGPSFALGIGVGAGLSSHFLRKRRFLSVILSDLLILIRYCRSGRELMIFARCVPSVIDWALGVYVVASIFIVSLYYFCIVVVEHFLAALRR